MVCVNEIIDRVGAAFIQEGCAVSEFSIRAVKRDGVFPASWYGVIKPECDRLGIECPMCLFSFKRPPNHGEAA